MPTGCENWEPNKCVRCGAMFGASSCFKPIKFGTKAELDEFYKSKGGKGSQRMHPKKITFDFDEFTEKVQLLETYFRNDEYYDREVMELEPKTGEIYHIFDRSDNQYDEKHPYVKKLVCKGEIHE